MYTVEQLRYMADHAKHTGIVANNPARTHFVRVCEEYADLLERLEREENQP